MTCRKLGLLLVVLALGACHKPRTEIMLTINSNLSVPAELDQVHVVVASEKSTTRFDQSYSLTSGTTKLPIVLGLVPDADKKLGFRAVAQGLKNGVVVVERSAVTSFVPDQTLALYLDLLRVCVQATCPANQTCGPQGTCVPESIQPADLPKFGATRDAGGGTIQGDGGLTTDAAVAEAAEVGGFPLDLGFATDHPPDSVGLEVSDAALPVSDTSPVIKLDVQPATPDVTPAVPDTTPVVPDTSPATPDATPDTGPVVTPDTALVVPDTRPLLDTSPEADTEPAIPCDKLGPWTSWAPLAIPLPTTAYCFRLCFTAPAGDSDGDGVSDAQEYHWGCSGFTNSDRTVTMNGQKMSCPGSGLSLPAEGEVVLTFVVSAGGHDGDAISWKGVLHGCP